MAQNITNDMKYMQIFSNGKLISAKLSPNPIYIASRNQYCYRIKCTFESGMCKKIQTKYYDTKAEAESMYPFYKKQTDEKRITIFKCTVYEFYTYWIRFYGFSKPHNELIKPYILPILGTKFVNNVTTSDLITILEKIPSAEFEEVYTDLAWFFEDAVEFYCAEQNNSSSAVRIVNERKKIQADQNNYCKTSSSTYSPQQLLQLLLFCKMEAPVLYIPMLLASTAALRISEIINITFQDIDFYNQSVCLPLSAKEELISRPGTVTIPEENKKVIFLPDFVMEEIRHQKERLNTLQKTNPSFNSDRYLIWGQDGMSRQNNFINKPYARICSRCPFPTFPWKAFRKIQLSPKSIKKLAEGLKSKDSATPHIYKIPIDNGYLKELMKLDR